MRWIWWDFGEKEPQHIATVLHVSQYSHGAANYGIPNIYQVYNFEMHANF